MLFTISLVLLSGWVLGVIGVYHVGDIVHMLLLVGLLLLMIAFLRARDAAMRRAVPGDADPR